MFVAISRLFILSNLHRASYCTVFSVNEHAIYSNIILANEAELMMPFVKTVVVDRFLKWLRPYLGVRPDWSSFALNSQWADALLGAKSGTKILIATNTGGNWACSAFESMLAAALVLRGANVSFILCDGTLNACQECDHQWINTKEFLRDGPQSSICGSCFSPAQDMLLPLGLPIIRFSKYFSRDDHSLLDLKVEPELEDHARAGALRYFGRGTLPEGKTGVDVLARYRQSAQITSIVMEAIIAEQSPDVVVFHHGIYVPQGIIGHVLRKNGVNVVNWGPAYRKGTVLFSHGDSYHHTMVDESPNQWIEMNWSEREHQQIIAYLDSRRTGSNDWISFQPESELEIGKFLLDIGLDCSRPIIGLLTNVIWDAQLHFKQIAFPAMLEWLFATIDHFIIRPDLQLVIRVHPAEVQGTVPSQQRAIDEILQRYGDLPSNIKIIGPEVNVSTYSLMARCNSALVYGTKTALELACNGLPVVVAGDAWCRNKGFTIDVTSPEQYQHILKSLPFAHRLNQEQIFAARKYAYHFFFRRMIPVRNLKPLKYFGPYKIQVDHPDELSPGTDRGLDLICDGILSGQDFVFEP